MSVRNYARPGSAPLIAPGTPGSTGGSLGSVTDGSTTVSPTTSLDFTSGATVTDLGGGSAGVAITGGMTNPMTTQDDIIVGGASPAGTPTRLGKGSDGQVLTVDATTHHLKWDTPSAVPAFATPSIVLSTAAAAGAASTVIRSDSTIAAFDATAPVTQALGDTAATGSAAFAARRDHKHGMPALSTATPLVESGTGATGTGTLSSREDHVHPAAAAGGDQEPVWNVQYNGDGATTAFTLPAAPFDAYSVAAFVGGVRTDVTLSGTLLDTMTFAVAPVSGTGNIVVDIVAAVV